MAFTSVLCLIRREAISTCWNKTIRYLQCHLFGQLSSSHCQSIWISSRETFKSVIASELNQIIACLPSYSSLTCNLPHTRKHYVVESVHPYLERSHQLHFPKGALQLQNDYSRLEAERITISVSCEVGKHTCGPICNKNPYS